MYPTIIEGAGALLLNLVSIKLFFGEDFRIELIYGIISSPIVISICSFFGEILSRFNFYFYKFLR
jgi:hypothetical protein